MKQVPNSRPKNSKHHCKKFIRPSGLVSGIGAPTSPI